MENDDNGIGGRGKNCEAEEVEEGEEEKMHKFFQLIRRFREDRDRRRTELKEMAETREGESNSKKRKAERKEESSWVPSFRLEDFTEEVVFRKPPLFFPSPCNYSNKNHKECQKNEPQLQDKESGLDLKLSL